MRNLNECITEALLSDKIEFIIQKLKSYELSEDTINNIYGILQSIDDKEFEDYCRSRGIEDIYEDILFLLKRYNDITKVKEIITNKDILPTSENLLKNNNIYDLFADLGVSKKFLEKLANTTPAKNSINRGMFEVLLQFFLQDITEGNKYISTSRGDVYTYKMGALELKGPGARIKGQTGNSPAKIDEMLNKILMEEGIIDNPEYTNVFGAQKTIDQVFNYDLNRLPQEKLVYLIGRSLINQFTKDENIIGEWMKFIKEYEKDFINNGKVNSKALLRFIGAMDMYFYQRSENWDYMIIFTGKSKSKIDGSYICISKEQCNTFKDIYNVKQIYYTGAPRSSTNSREWVMNLYATK